MNNNLKTNILLLTLICVVAIGVVALLLKKDSVPTPLLNDNNREEINNEVIGSEKQEGLSPVLSLEGATTQVPGANPVTADNIVVTPEGRQTKTNVAPLSENAPRETGSISPENLSKEVIKLNVSAAGFDPKEITVKSGDAVSIALTSTDTQTHILRFDDPSLSAVAIGVSSKETRAISFNAPKQTGEYTFYCRVLGHSGRGETGKMIVK